MKKFISILFISIFLCFVAGPASAESILYDWWVDVDGNLNQAGATYTAPAIGGDITNVTGFDTSSTTWGDPEAIGTVEITFNPGVAGSYNVESFFDVEINEWINGFDDEYGNVVGLPQNNTAPQYGFADSWHNTSLPYSQSDTDIALWMGYNFTLAANEFALITFTLTDINPGGSYLEQYDIIPVPGAAPIVEHVYLTSILSIQGGGPGPQPVPEPATLLLMGSGFVGLFGLRRRIIK